MFRVNNRVDLVFECFTPPEKITSRYLTMLTLISVDLLT